MEPRESRRVRADDWRLLREVRLSALLDAPDAFFSTYAEEAALGDEDWKGRASSMATSATAAAYIVLGENHRAIGMAGVRQKDPELVVVWGVWVEPAWRGTGAGSALIANVERWALENTESTRLALQVADGNERAAAFYRRLGYRPSGVRTPFRDGSGLMETELVKSVR